MTYGDLAKAAADTYVCALQNSISRKEYVENARPL